MSFNRKTSKSGQATLLTLWSDNGDSVDGEDFKDSEQSQPVSNKRAQWISSSFDDFGQNSGEKKSSFSTANKGGKKRPRDTQANKSTVKTSQKPRKIEIETEIWADVHKPKLQADLAVHKKKIAEVELWLQQHISHTAHIKTSSPILLLTGPAGAGKTATINVLCQEMGLELQEWINPTTSSYDADRTYPGVKPIGGYTSESQQSLFHDFLLRANKYQTLQIFGDSSGATKKIILVEDLPNIFFRDPHSFHDILRKYSSTGRCPLVFIISDTSGSSSGLRNLFPKDVQLSLGIDNISFNPVAPTSMTKVMTRIAQYETNQGHHKFTLPSKSTIDELAVACSGDIRGAINALQFTCLQNPGSAHYQKVTFTKKKSSSSKHQKSLPSRSKRKDSTNKQKDDGGGSDMAAIGGRDHSMFLFRALGKILYCKRDPKESDCVIPELPQHLLSHDRDPLNFTPEDVIERSHMSSENFTLFLHQNYLDFYSSIDDVVDASLYLSDADHLTKDWASRSALREYSSCVGARGLVHCNTARSRSGSTSGGGGWKPLHKPQWYEVNRKYRERCLTARHLFSKHCQTPEDLQIQFMPYLALINVPLSTPGQISFLQEVCKFSSSCYPVRTQPEKLNEQDTGEVDDDEDEVSKIESSQNTDIDQSDFQTVVDECSEDELIIEDFDD